MAIQVARRLGAGRVVAAGRRVERLEGSSADRVVSLEGDPASVGRAIGDAASEADIVLDYLWGDPAANAMVSLLTARADRSKPLVWIQIGSVAGPTMALPSVALRSANVRVMGSGQGSVSTRDIVGELPRLVDELVARRLVIDTKSVPLASVETTWDAASSDGKRVVFIP
jgi:NADPH:quinone reductase-like Zn-dependent oxidoreductase